MALGRTAGALLSEAGRLHLATQTLLCHACAEPQARSTPANPSTDMVSALRTPACTALELLGAWAMYQRPARFSFSCLSAMMPVAATATDTEPEASDGNRWFQENREPRVISDDTPSSRITERSTQHPSRLTFEIGDGLRDNGLQASVRRRGAGSQRLTGKGGSASALAMAPLLTSRLGVASEAAGEEAGGSHAKALFSNRGLSWIPGAFLASWMASLSTTMTPPAVCHSGNLETKRVSAAAGLRRASSLLQRRIPCVLPPRLAARSRAKAAKVKGREHTKPARYDLKL